MDHTDKNSKLIKKSSILLAKATSFA